MEFNISYTESTNIPETKNEGNVYITNDTSQMYVDLNADLRIQIGDLYIVQSIPPSHLLLNKFYYNETNGYLYFYNGSWNKLNDINLGKEDINKILELEGGINLDQQLYLAIETTDSVEKGNMKPITSNAVKKAFEETVVNVNVVNVVEAGNMNAISSNAVYEVLGDIEMALQGI